MRSKTNSIINTQLTAVEEHFENFKDQLQELSRAIPGSGGNRIATAQTYIRIMPKFFKTLDLLYIFTADTALNNKIKNEIENLQKLLDKLGLEQNDRDVVEEVSITFLSLAQVLANLINNFTPNTALFISINRIIERIECSLDYNSQDLKNSIDKKVNSLEKSTFNFITTEINILIYRIANTIADFSLDELKNKLAKIKFSENSPIKFNIDINIDKIDKLTTELDLATSEEDEQAKKKEIAYRIAAVLFLTDYSINAASNNTTNIDTSGWIDYVQKNIADSELTQDGYPIQLVQYIHNSTEEFSANNEEDSITQALKLAEKTVIEITPLSSPESTISESSIWELDLSEEGLSWLEIDTNKPIAKNIKILENSDNDIQNTDKLDELLDIFNGAIPQIPVTDITDANISDNIPTKAEEVIESTNNNSSLNISEDELSAQNYRLSINEQLKPLTFSIAKQLANLNALIVKTEIIKAYYYLSPNLQNRYERVLIDISNLLELIQQSIAELSSKNPASEDNFNRNIRNAILIFNKINQKIADEYNFVIDNQLINEPIKFAIIKRLKEVQEALRGYNNAACKMLAKLDLNTSLTLEISEIHILQVSPEKKLDVQSANDLPEFLQTETKYKALNEKELHIDIAAKLEKLDKELSKSAIPKNNKKFIDFFEEAIAKINKIYRIVSLKPIKNCPNPTAFKLTISLASININLINFLLKKIKKSKSLFTLHDLQLAQETIIYSTLQVIEQLHSLAITGTQPIKLQFYGNAIILLKNLPSPTTFNLTRLMKFALTAKKAWEPEIALLDKISTEDKSFKKKIVSSITQPKTHDKKTGFLVIKKLINLVKVEKR